MGKLREAVLGVARNRPVRDQMLITAHRSAGFAAWRSLTRYPLSRFGNA